MSNRATLFGRQVLGIWYARKWCLFALLLVTVAYGVGSVADRHARTVYGNLPGDDIRHGWPVECIFRSSTDALWAELQGRWQPFAGIYKVEYGLLLFDLGVAAGLSLLLTHFWHYHCTRRGQWQFSLKELFVVSIVLSIALGFYVKQRSDFDRETAYLAKLEQEDWWNCKTTPILDSSCHYENSLPWFFRPLRDLGITRDEDWDKFDLGWNAYRRYTAPKNVNNVLKGMAPRPITFSFIEGIYINDPQLNDEGIAALCAWAPDCATLNLYVSRWRESTVTDGGIACIAESMRHLRSFTLNGGSLTDAGVRNIATMKCLENLEVDDPRCTTTNAALPDLLKLPRLDSLRVPSHWAIDAATKAEAARRGIDLDQFHEVSPVDPHE